MTNNRVREKVLQPADPRYVDYPPLPYEAAIDRERADRTRRRRGAKQPDGIVDLASRRS